MITQLYSFVIIRLCKSGLWTSLFCVLDSFVEYDGYSISSKGFLPTVVDITVFWVKFRKIIFIWENNISMQKEWVKWTLITHVTCAHCCIRSSGNPHSIFMRHTLTISTWQKRNWVARGKWLAQGHIIHEGQNQGFNLRLCKFQVIIFSSSP